MDAKLKHPFEALAVRYVHDPRNDEFLNVGVVLVCADRQFVGAKFLSQWSRISNAFSGTDLPLIRKVARAFNHRCDEWMAAAEQLPIEPWSIEAFLKSVMAQDDGSIRFSAPIDGITSNPQQTLSELFSVYAGAHEDADVKEARQDADVWRTFVNRVSATAVRRLQQKTIKAPHYELAFDTAWKNGRWHVAQPISLDMVDHRAIRDKAVTWSGRILTLRPEEQDTSVHLLVGMPRDGNATSDAANDALAILRENLRDQAHVYTEAEGEKLARKMEQDLDAAE